MCAVNDVAVNEEHRRRLELRHRLQARRSRDPPPDISKDAPPLDTLAAVTAHQRRLFNTVSKKVDLFTQLPLLKTVLRTTQPAHVLAVASVLVVCFCAQQLTSAQPSSPLVHLAHLAAFSAHLGNQFWMTFVSGLALYFNLPRHDFGAVQKVLFPKYFSINSFLSLVTLVTFVKLHHLTSFKYAEIFQVVTLSTCFLLELSTRLCLVPSVLWLITAKTELEVAAGVGREVGHLSPGPLMACPYYKRLHLEFRRQHLMVAGGNMAAMACTCFHLYFMAYNYAGICAPLSSS